jgi:hypothetical protein
MTRHTFEARKGKYHPDNGLAGNEWMKTFSNQVGPESFTDALGTVRPAAWFRVSGSRDDVLVVDYITRTLARWLSYHANREDGERCPSGLATDGIRITVTPKGREAGFSSPPKGGA